MTNNCDTHPVVILGQDRGVRTRVATDLAAALLPTAFTMPPDGCALLIVDVPDLSEDALHSVLEQVKTPDDEQDTPVILLTDDASASAREAAFVAGVSDVLPRDVTTDLLIARATRLMTMGAMLTEARHLGDRALLATAAPTKRPTARVFHLRSRGAQNIPQSTDWNMTAFTTPETLLSATMQGWPDVIALPGVDAARLLPGLISRRGALDTQFVTLETPPGTCSQCLALGAADAIPQGVSSGEIAARISMLAIAAQDIHRAHADLRAGLEMSHSDALTGLRTRRFFDQRFRGLFERARLLSQPLSVLAFDIDDFKQINDAYGHPAGDAILINFASRLSANVRAEDLVTRYGGEEFFVAMPQATTDVAMIVAERVRAAIAAPGFPVGGGRMAPMTVSVGVATISNDDMRAEDLLSRADVALYRAKGLGRNRVARAA